jgi:hypothetical protein
MLLDGPLPDLCDLGVVDLDFVNGVRGMGDADRGQRHEPETKVFSLPHLRLCGTESSVSDRIDVWEGPEVDKSKNVISDGPGSMPRRCLSASFDP